MQSSIHYFGLLLELGYLELTCYVSFQQPEPENERNIKWTPSLSFTQQFQIAISNTMAGRHTMPD